MSLSPTEVNAFDRAQAAAAAVPRKLLIGGEWQDADSGRTFAVLDPATGEKVAVVADASAGDAGRALDAAVSAQVSWAKTTGRERSRILRTAAALLRERSEDVAALLTLEMGKPLGESRGEVNYAADFFDWFSEEAVRLAGSLSPSPVGGTTIGVTREPVGPCVLVTPWNFPAAMPARKLAPALAAGCTAVLKPAELTPLCAAAVLQVLIDAGLPEGVANLIPTTDPAGVIAPLLADARTRKLSFTGSTPVGKLLMSQASENVLRISLELGGNAPLIVCRDADLNVAVQGAVLAKMRNNGEACTAANRIYVDSAVVDEFTDRFAERLGAMEVGHGLAEGVEIGPLISRAGLEKAQRVISTAVADGAMEIVGQPVPADLAGSFCPATVLANTPADSKALLDEVFAPVAPIIHVTDEDEALCLANRTEYGLVAYVFTTDLDRARRLGGGLESGMVGINTGLVSNVAAPFGGVKWSGIGREGSAAGIEEYLETKYTATLDPRSSMI